MGHTGIRNRIGFHMRMKTMIKLEWDLSLQKMAEIYFRKNSLFEDDACTNYEKGYTAKEQYEYFETGKNAHDFIAQNRYCIESTYFPLNLVELAVRSFYYDRNNLVAPKQTDFDDMIKKKSYELLGINNFTHLGYGLSHRFGCAIAK